MAKAAAAGTITTIRDYLGGSWRSSESAEHLQDINPATGEVLAQLPIGDADTVDEAVSAARAAFPAWRATPPAERVRHLFALRELLRRHREELARIIVTDMGKTLDDARGEVARGIDNVEAACATPQMMMGYGLADGAARGIDEEVMHQPLGVFAGITPFNFPFMIATWFWPYAVAAGNTYVLKPSEQDPLVQQRVFELIDEAGFPAGVINLVNGGPAVVDALLDHPAVEGISFVGSTSTAQYIYRRAAAKGKRVQASGGAKNAVVIMPDTNLDRSLTPIMNSLFGAAGQRCLANSLIMPVGPVHETVVGRIAGAARKIRLGDGLQPGVDLGPVISAAARDRIVTAISSGIEEGADAVLDGRSVHVAERPNGYFVGPTVLDGVLPDMRVYRDEIFGPVVSTTPVGTLEEAIAMINASPYGNGASIFTSSGPAAREFRYQVQAGNIGINVGVPAPTAVFPFGGAKNSFFGVLHPQGKDAVRFFTETKVVLSRWDLGALSEAAQPAPSLGS